MSTASEQPPVRQRRVRSVTELLASVVLGFESVVVFLAALVLFGLKTLPPAIALGGGWGLAVLMLALVGLLRWQVGIIAGWIVQALVIASGLIQPTMFFVGIVFASAWTYAMIAGARIDKKKAS